MSTSDIDCIIVGKDCAGTLRACVESIRAAGYMRGTVHLYYRDKGSKDNSREVAKELGLASGEGSSPLVQILSADTTLAPDWFNVATKGLSSDIAAVRGRREQPDPHKDALHRIYDLEENPPVGDLSTIQGDCIMRRDGKGRYLMLPEVMQFRESEVQRWDQWWGWARHLPCDRKEVLVRGGGSMLLVLIAIIGMAWVFWWIALLLPAAIILLYPRIFDVKTIASSYGINEKDAALFALHRSLRVIPRFFSR